MECSDSATRSRYGPESSARTTRAGSNAAQSFRESCLYSLNQTTCNLLCLAASLVLYVDTGVGTRVDPTVCRSDRLVGQVLGSVGKVPDIYTELEINYFLLRRLLGVKTDDKKQSRVEKLAKNEILMVNIGSTTTGGRVVSVKADLAKIMLTQPACTEIGEKISLSRRIDQHWRLIGWGTIKRGVTIQED